MSKGKAIAAAALTFVLGIGGYLAASYFQQERARSTPGSVAGPMPDARPDSGRMEMIPAPDVSTSLQALPESDSVLISPPSRKD